MPTTEFPRRRQRGRPPKYNWDRYFEPQQDTGLPGQYILQQGRDFQTKPASFRALVHATARNRTDGGPWRAETQVEEETGRVLFRFVPKER
jgi:hypothetical protein